LPFLPVDAGAAEQGKGGKWAGVDEAVIEKIAGEHGREAKEPLIGDDQGDILLFLFLLAGAVGGFVAGYYWRVLITEKRRRMLRVRPHRCSRQEGLRRRRGNETFGIRKQ